MKLSANQPYVTSETTNKGIRLLLDKESFAAALATALGGTMRRDGEPDSIGWTCIKADGIEILVETPHSATAFNLSLSYPKRWHDLYRVRKTPPLPRISVGNTRPIAQIAADVRRRLIEPAKVAVAEGDAMLAELDGTRATMKAEADKLTARYPDMRIKIDDTGTHAAFDVQGVYCMGRLYHDGGLTIDRIETLKGARRDAVLDALLKG